MGEQAKQLLEIYTLGGLNICQGRVPVTGLTSSKAEALIVYLAVTGRPCSREVLAELLWENRPQNRSLANLRVVLTSIREHLAPYFEITRQVVALAPHSAIWLDAVELEGQVNAASRELQQLGRLSQAAAVQLKQALDLYQGSFLEGFYIRDSSAFDNWVSTERQRLERMAVEALDRLVDSYTEINEYGAALGLAQRLLKLDPFREITYRKLMRLSAYRGERIVALEYYDACCQVLSDELGIEPDQETTATYKEIAAGRIGASKRLSSPGRLQVGSTTLVGREQEMAEVMRLLETPPCRLLTLTGPGGIGKTRLAQEAIARVGGYPDGIYFCSLAAVDSREALVAEMASSIQFTFQGTDDAATQLLDYLSDKTMLLVLDGFEHLVDKAADLLAEALARAKAVRFLVTSRRRLDLRDEWLRLLKPLPFPSSPDIQDAESYEAVRLFLHHARRVRSGFAITDDNRSHVTRICQQVGGNPLGIELAAAWTRMLPCSEIEDEIQHNLDFLVSSHRDTAERHQSVKAVFQHSWSLLSSEEQAALKQLSAFVGGFQRKAASTVAGASFPVLSTLVDQSLIRSNLRGRYELHELVHHYAAEKLAEHPDDLTRTQEQHAKFYADFVCQRESLLSKRGRNEMLEQIEEEGGNIHVAWQWALRTPHTALIAQMLKGMWFFYDAQNRYEEALTAFSRTAEALQASSTSSTDEVLVGRALGCQGWFLYRKGRTNEAKALLQKSVEWARQYTTWPEIAFSLTLFGLVCNSQGEYALAREACQESLAISEEIGDRWSQAVSLNVLGNVARNRSQHEEARELCQESLALSRAEGDPQGVAISLNDLGQLAFRMGEYEEARRLFEESLEMSVAVGDALGLAIATDRLGKVAEALGDYETAWRLYEESLDRSRSIGDTLGIAISLNCLSSVACAQGKLQQAHAFCSESVDICRRINSKRGLMFSLYHLARVAYLQETYDKAWDLYEHSLAIARQLDDAHEAASMLNGLCEIARAQGDVQASRAYVCEALEANKKGDVGYRTLDTLLKVADCSVDDGNLERALRLVGFVKTHPAAWQYTRDRAQDLWDELAARLPPDVVQTATCIEQDAPLADVIAESLCALQERAVT